MTSEPLTPASTPARLSTCWERLSRPPASRLKVGTSKTTRNVEFHFCTKIDLPRIFQYETAMIPSRSLNFITSEEISQFSYTVKMQKLKSFSREIPHLNEFECLMFKRVTRIETRVTALFQNFEKTTFLKFFKDLFRHLND